jgi:uncharacterized membrane protein
VTAPTLPAVATISTKPSAVTLQAPRLVSVDILRGLAMVVMALDHTRDFMTYLRIAPEGVAHTYGALFFTRFITHYCAPIFSFLAGTGAFLSTRRGKSIPQLSGFFLSRGLWLVLLEFTIVDFAWGFVPWAHAGVIWILGVSMVVMALIIWLPVRWIAVLGLGMIATHNLLDGIRAASFGKFYWLWILLHSPGSIPVTAHFSLSTRYVLIPWVGVMATGFAFGALLQRPDRRKWILTLGISATALFFVLRGFNLYGNGIVGTASAYARSAGPWSIQPTISLSVISFFNTLKYPPSLQYLLMTLGPALILLGLLDGARAQSGLGRILAGLRPGSTALLRLASLPVAPHGYGGLARLSPARLARHCHSGFRAKACGVWSRSSLHLRDVDFGRRDLVSALFVVHEFPQQASGLALAQLPVTINLSQA